MRVLLVFVLCVASSALAIAKGGKLYISAKDTVLLKQPNAKAAKVARLALGSEVTWLGPSDKDKSFHEVEADGKKGFVHSSSLTPNKPQLEVDATSGELQTFANSGAATRDHPVSQRYADPASNTAAAELIYLEELNKTKATPEAVAQKNKELHAP